MPKPYINELADCIADDLSMLSCVETITKHSRETSFRKIMIREMHRLEQEITDYRFQTRIILEAANGK